MTAQRLSRIALGIAVITVVGVAALVTRNVLWPEDPDASLQRAGGKVLGDMAGYVGQVDRDAHTVDVSSSPLGIRPVVLVVTNETAIVVNGKQGGLGDLWKDLPVRVVYEVRDNARYATSIQVTSNDATVSSPNGSATAPATDSKPAVDQAAGGTGPRDTKATPAQAAAPAQPVPPAPVPSAVTAGQPKSPGPTVLTGARPPAVVPPVAPPVNPPPPPMPPAAASAPASARAPEPAAAKAPARVATPPTATESASVSSPRGGAAPPPESEADGSAAIDWLLKESGRR